MMWFAIEFVLNVSLPKVNGVDQTQVHHHVERAVNCRLVETRNVPPRVPQNLLRGQMLARLAEDGQDDFALRRQAEARLAQVVEGADAPIATIPYCN